MRGRGSCEDIYVRGEGWGYVRVHIHTQGGRRRLLIPTCPGTFFAFHHQFEDGVRSTTGVIHVGGFHGTSRSTFTQRLEDRVVLR